MKARERGSISIWLAFGLIGIAVLGFLLVMAVAIGIALASGAPSFAAAAEAFRRDLGLLALAQLGGLVLATGAGVLVSFGHDEPFREALDIRPVPLAISVLALSAGLALQLPFTEVANLLAELHPSLGVDAEAEEALRRMIHIGSARDAIVVPLAIVAMPAISEELFFRGLLLPGLTRRYTPRVALVASALLFGVVHGMPGAIVYASLAGFVLGAVRQQTGSVLPCIALHGAFNAVPLLVPSSLVAIEGFNTGEGHVPLPLVLGSALVAVIALVFIARLAADPEDD